MTRHRVWARRPVWLEQHAWKRQRALLGAWLLVGAALAACAHNPEPSADAESAAADTAGQPVDTSVASQEVELTGRVVNSGTDRFTITTLQAADAPATRLTGVLLDELRTLAGAEVTVRGTIDASGPGRSLDVREYELLAIEGKRPRVGRVLLRDGGVWLAAVDTVQLVSALDALRDLAGAKIWVVGATQPGDAGLRVESYGVIARAR